MAKWSVRLLPAVIVVAVVLAYVGSLPAPFILDDDVVITKNPNLDHLWPFDFSMGARIAVDFSFKLNNVLGGLNSADFRAVNIALHIAAALFLYGVVRRTLSLSSLPRAFRGAASWIAFVSAMIWAMHPLQTESVTYICQRYESMMGAFFFASFYCFVRGAGCGGGDSEAGKTTLRKRLWFDAGIMTCIVGMASKEVMVVFPVVLLLYDYVFLGGPNRDRLFVHIAMFMSVGVVVCLRLSSIAHSGIPVGGISVIRYALTQPEVVLHYLRLAFIPYPLCIDYAWPMVSGVGEAVVPCITVGLICAVVVWRLLQRGRIGFLMAMFFIVLAPTSTVLPLSDVAFEHRMYIPLAPLVVIGVISVFGFFERVVPQPLQRKWYIMLSTMVIGALISLTMFRNKDYLFPCRLWEKAARCAPHNPRPYNSLALTMLQKGRFEETIDYAAKAIWTEHYGCGPQEGIAMADVSGLAPTRDARAVVLAHTYAGIACQYLAHHEEAIGHYRRALEIDPSFSDARNNAAKILISRDDLDGAEGDLSIGLTYDPVNADAHSLMGDILMLRKDYRRAMEHYRLALSGSCDRERVLNLLRIAASLAKGRTE